MWLPIGALVIFATVFYSFAYANVYTAPHPATRASEYIRENVPSGSVLAMEHWEEGLPNLHSYPRITLQLYDPDDIPNPVHQPSRASP